MNTFLHLWQYLAEFLLELEMFRIKVVGNIKRHTLYSIIFSRNSCRLWENVEKYDGAREYKDDNMMHACRIPDK